MGHICFACIESRGGCEPLVQSRLIMRIRARDQYTVPSPTRKGRPPTPTEIGERHGNSGRNGIQRGLMLKMPNGEEGGDPIGMLISVLPHRIYIMSVGDEGGRVERIVGVHGSCPKSCGIVVM